MHCDVHYYYAKFKIKIQFMYGETKKKTLYMGVKWTKLHSLGGKLNIVSGVIQTLSIFEARKLDIFH